MAYIEMGDPDGDPIVFLHGNPTSSYLWRKVMPHCAPFGRCIAPDLIGMGDSSRLPNSGPGVYTYQTHREYMKKFFDALDIHENLTLVIHDWGSALGFEKASVHPESIKAIVYMESLLSPQTPAGGEGGGRPGGGRPGRPPSGGPSTGGRPGGPPGGGRPGGAMRVENTGGGGMFSLLRSPAGDEAVLQNNMFVEDFF
ncbi:MAG: alpha/beta fold hydrolase, partial [Rhodospirillaceae bacterium]|nr:alpha/beta fold hydrolase [Rhodospirillaceae bacterium]